MKKQVGFIGLGEMGKWMALNLLKKGFPLLVHYHRRKKAMRYLVNQGAQATNDLSEIGERCRWIVLCLPDSSVLDSVFYRTGGLKPTLKAGDIVVDCGTTSPLFTQLTATTLKKERIYFIDAPISGMENRAKEGTLTIMVGGPKSAYQKISPLLEAMGKNIIYMGPSGNGQLAKMTNNVLFNISCAAMAEILPMAVKLCLDPEIICSVVSTGTGQSHGFDFFSKLVLENNFARGYPLKSAYKDMDIAIEIAIKKQIPMPVTAATMQTYQMALGQGFGSERKKGEERGRKGSDL